MEQALAAILDEAAARAQEEDRLAEEAAQRGSGPLGFLEEEEEEEAAQASSGGSRGAVACCLLATAYMTLRNHWWSRTRYQGVFNVIDKSCTCCCKQAISALWDGCCWKRVSEVNITCAYQCCKSIAFVSVLLLYIRSKKPIECYQIGCDVSRLHALNQHFCL